MFKTCQIEDCILFFSGRNKNFVIKISRHYKKQYNSTTRQTDDCIFFFPVVIARTAHPTDRRLYLFFSGRNRQNRAPNRQTTVSFFFPVIIARTAHPSDRRLYLFFSGRNVSFFPVVMKISRHNKKTANFLPSDDCIFFFRS